MYKKIVQRFKFHYFVSGALHMYAKILAAHHADIIYQASYQYGQSAVAADIFCHVTPSQKHRAPDHYRHHRPIAYLRTKVSLFINLQSVSYFNRLIAHYKFFLSSRSKLLLHSKHVRHLQQPILQKLLCERLQRVPGKAR